MSLSTGATLDSRKIIADKRKMAEVSDYSIFTTAWFWLLVIALIFFLIGVALVAFVGTGWGVLLIILGVILLIAAGIAGFISSSRTAALAVLNSEAGAQVVTTFAANYQLPVANNQMASQSAESLRNLERSVS